VNGQFAFGLFNPLLGDTQVNVINPDGTGQRLVQGPTETGELRAAAFLSAGCPTLGVRMPLVTVA
jgi:hypothetical protein